MATPLTPEEEARFVREMTTLVADLLAAGKSFQIRGNPDLARLYHQVTSRVAERLGRPVTGMAHGREFRISLRTAESLEA